MKILQVMHEMLPRKRARAGGQLGTFQTLCALSDLGHEVHLAVCGGPFDVESEVVERCAGIHWIAPRSAGPARRVASRVFQPETWALRHPDSKGYASTLRNLALGLAVDLVWADGILGIAVAPRTTVPTIYGHYDFLHLLRPARRASRKLPRSPRDWTPTALRHAVHRPSVLSDSQVERIELNHCRESALVVSVSGSVAQRLTEDGIAAAHIPLVGPTIPRPPAEMRDSPRFFLFGNHNTANRAILSEIRQKIWPETTHLCTPAHWHQVGTVKPQERDADWEWASNNFEVMHGYVENLTDVFAPGDISIVAYPFDTGTRAKFAVAAAHGVPSAGYTTSFLCAPEFTGGLDAIVAESPSALALELDAVARDRTRRAGLAHAVRAAYERHFTYEAQLPLYATALERAVGAAADSRSA